MNATPRVLIVDDEQPICDFMALVLGTNGYDVRIAKDGREGVKLYRSVRPNLIISDIAMPDMEGIEFIRTLIRKKCGTPIIAMSGDSVGTNFLNSAVLLGATDFLAKPFTARKLSETVKRVWKEGCNPIEDE